MRKGFTLVELSIVLIIIGLIIGGVMKGKDLIGGAEQKKIYNTWVKGWQVAANSYQDRTGAILGDGAINGGAPGVADGQADNIDLAATTTVQDRLEAIGLDVPVGNIVATRGGNYVIKGKYTTSTAVASLSWVASATDGVSRNRLSITGMPTDVAIAFDKMTDGDLNARTGDFRIFTDAQDWPDASTTLTVTATLEF